jgi:amino acid transporter
MINGGTAGGIWMFFVVCVGMFFVMLSMAEMASMCVATHQKFLTSGSLCGNRAPTSGGQYHWVSEMAPRKYQKFLSYMVGKVS